MVKGGSGISLCDAYDYNKISSIKRALKGFFKLGEKATEHGNYDALAILSDMKSSLSMYKNPVTVLTDRQMECVKLCLIEDYTEVEAAEELGISQQAVHYSLNSAVKRIQIYLTTGQTRMPVFSRMDEQELLRLYKAGCKPQVIAHILNKSPKTIRNKIKYLKKKGRLEAEEHDGSKK